MKTSPSRTRAHTKNGGVQANPEPFTPLPPLRGQPSFPHYTVNQVATMPCGASWLREQVLVWWEKWQLSDAACNVALAAELYYEALRHHPYFQREAAALRNFMESQRELSALFTALNGEETAVPENCTGITPPWDAIHTRARESAPQPVASEKGEVAA